MSLDKIARGERRYGSFDRGVIWYEVWTKRPDDVWEQFGSLQRAEAEYRKCVDSGRFGQVNLDKWAGRKSEGSYDGDYMGTLKSWNK